MPNDTDKAKMPENSSSENRRGDLGDRDLLHLGLVIVFGIFATTLPQPGALARLPLQFLLKNQVGVTREQMAAFFFWCGLAWYLKPFAGILLNSGTTAIVLVLLPFLPGALRQSKDKAINTTQRDGAAPVQR